MTVLTVAVSVETHVDLDPTKRSTVLEAETALEGLLFVLHL